MPDPVSDSVPEGLSLGSDATPDPEWCRVAVRDVSRTFALTVDVLEEPMASEITLGYLLCRVPDTIEDTEQIPPDQQADLLRRYERALDPAAEATIGEFRAAVDRWLPPEADRSDDWQVVAAAPTVVATFAALPQSSREAIRPPVRELVDGMATFVDRYADAGGIRIQTKAELEEYCHYAAGTVGQLITRLLAPAADPDRRETMENTAGSFARLLQLVNVAKDVYDDYTDENNVYLPAAWLAEEGVSQEEILAADNRAGATRAVERTAALARAQLNAAGRYLTAMPLARGNTLAAWAVPYLLAVGTLRELEAAPEAALKDERVAISRPEVFAVVEAVRRGDRSDVPHLRALIEREPLD